MDPRVSATAFGLLRPGMTKVRDARHGAQAGNRHRAGVRDEFHMEWELTAEAQAKKDEIGRIRVMERAA
jgi:hypothetical protein